MGLHAQPNPPAAPSRLERVAWAAWAAAWLAEYVVVLVAPLEWGLQPINYEEAGNGALAWGLAHGLPFSIWSYQYVPHAHGPLVYGLGLVPFYFLGGSSLLWTKILAGVFAAAGAFGWTALARGLWGRREGWLVAAWMLAPPTYLARMFHVGWANHMESIGLGALVLGGGLWALAPGRRKAAALWGLAAGLSTFFCLQVLAFATAAATAAAWRHRRRAALALPLAALGFAAGYAPHFAYLAWRGQGFGPPSIPSPGEALGRWFDLAAHGLPWLPGYGLPAACAAFGFAVLLAVVSLGLSALAGRRRGDAGAEAESGRWFGRSLALYAAWYLVFYGVAPYSVVSEGAVGEVYWLRYLLPLLPVGMLAVARAASTRLGRWAWLVIAAFAALHGADAWRSIQNAPRDTPTHGARDLLCLRGDRPLWYARTGMQADWTRRFPAGEDPLGRLRAIRDEAERLPEWLRPSAWEYAGAELPLDLLRRGDAIEAAAGADARRSVLTGLGRALVNAAADADGPGALDVLDERSAEAQTAGDRAALVAGFAHALFERRFTNFDIEVVRRDSAAAADLCGVSQGETGEIPPSGVVVDAVLDHADWSAADKDAFVEAVGSFYGYAAVAPPNLARATGRATGDAQACRALERGYARGEALFLVESRRCVASGAERLAEPLARMVVRLEPDGRGYRLIEDGAPGTE